MASRYFRTDSACSSTVRGPSTCRQHGGVHAGGVAGIKSTSATHSYNGSASRHARLCRTCDDSGGVLAGKHESMRKLAAARQALICNARLSSTGAKRRFHAVCICTAVQYFAWQAFQTHHKRGRQTNGDPKCTRAMNAGSQAAALMARMPCSSSPVRLTRASLAAIMSVLALSMRRASHLKLDIVDSIANQEGKRWYMHACCKQRQPIQFCVQSENGNQYGARETLFQSVGR